MSNTDNAKPVFYCVAVKGPNGRKWFAADSAQSGDREMVENFAANCTALYGHLGLKFAALATSKVGDIAPRKYRPWDTDEDEGDDVNLDALDESEL
jgi:hypothetical protein